MLHDNIHKASVPRNKHLFSLWIWAKWESANLGLAGLNSSVVLLEAANQPVWLEQLGSVTHDSHLPPTTRTVAWTSPYDGRSTTKQAENCRSSLGFSSESVHHQLHLPLLAKARHMTKTSETTPMASGAVLPCKWEGESKYLTRIQSTTVCSHRNWFMSLPHIEYTHPRTLSLYNQSSGSESRILWSTSLWIFLFWTQRLMN